MGMSTSHESAGRAWRGKAWILGACLVAAAALSARATGVGELALLLAGLFLGGAIVLLWPRPGLANAALKRSEERFRALIEHATEAISVLDADGKRIYASPAASRIIGYSEDELVGGSITDQLHPDDVALMRRAQERLLANPGEIVEARYRLRHKDGRWRWLEATGRNLLDNPSVRGMVANYRDITDRKESDDALRLSEERFRALVENAADSVALVDAQGQFISSGGSPHGILGYSDEEMVGKSFRILLHPVDAAGAEALFTRVGSEPEGVGYFALRARHLDGTWRWIEGVAKNLLANPAVGAIVVNYHDVTQRKETEEDSERRGRILEAVAFGAARLLEPGSWRERADEVLSRLGGAADVARIHVGENVTDPDGATRGLLRFAWTAPGVEELAGIPQVQAGLRWADVGWGSWAEEMRQGRPVIGLVSELPDNQRPMMESMGALAFGSVPIMVSGEWWGLLGIQETRYERAWSAPEVEALKAAAAVFSAAIERDRGDTALQESEERFRRLADATSEGIALTENGVFLDANDQLGAILGCDARALVGRRVQEFVTPEAWEAVALSQQTGSEAPYRHTARRLDGTPVPVEVRARSSPHRGRTIRVSAIRDISAQVEAAEKELQLHNAIRKAALEWRLTFDAIESPVLVMTPEGGITRLNHAAQLLCDRSYTELTDGNIADLGPSEPWPTSARLLAQVVESRNAQSEQARDASSGRTWEVGATLLSGGERVILVARDVTRTIALQESLRRSETMSAMGSLVAGVAHEVRNPLFSISANLDAFEAEVGERPGVGEVFTVLRTEVQRLSALMQDLLEYGRPHTLELELGSLGDVVSRAVASTRGLAHDRKVDVVNAVPGNLRVPMDMRRVEQVVENLVVNSIQHLKTTGSVRVTASLAREGERGWAVCAVEDSGPGFREQDLPHIFEPFFTRRHGGTGLGLSIVARIVDDHGGRIEARNRAEGGAEVVFKLPLERR
jgi:PAS domain S-box-containing protein